MTPCKAFFVIVFNINHTFLSVNLNLRDNLMEELADNGL